ncbi:MAG: hypothetical protein IKO33_01875 [Bacteroidaceae bacterium]|nr:hypothetical protein [Bacteroidaceae bacterium]
MKRNYLWIAATAMIMAGCTNTDILRDTSALDKPALITFDTYHSKSTKAPVNSEVDLTIENNGFGVFAFKHETTKTISEGKIDLSGIAKDYTNPVFDNTKTWYNPNYNETSSPFYTKYQYEFPRYWDKQMFYTFFAYSPYTAYSQVVEDTDDADYDATLKGVTLFTKTGLITRTDIHSVQCASDSKDTIITNGNNPSITRKKYFVIPKSATADASDKDIKDYTFAPCVPGQKWHATNQTVATTDPKYYENSEITVGFIFHHALSQLKVNVKAKNEENDPDDNTKNGHEYKGIKSIYLTKLEITNLPPLTDLDNNYITCSQNKVDFGSIYKYTKDEVVYNPLTFNPSNYNDKNLEIVKKTAEATSDNPAQYLINGTDTGDPLYILDGGYTLSDAPAGSSTVNGYIDQNFVYYVAPNLPTVTDKNKHNLVIEYYIDYMDNKSEKFSRTIQLDGAPFNFDEMLASYVYKIGITISLDQIYITVDDVLWNSGPSTPADINISGDEL